MRKQARLAWFFVGLLAVCALYLWWDQLPLHRKVFYKNFIRQVPDLPGRYMA